MQRIAVSLRERIGVDVGRKLRLEQAVEWAAANQVGFIDVQLDTGANALGTIDDKRAATVRAACEKHGVRLGLHTASAVMAAALATWGRARAAASPIEPRSTERRVSMAIPSPLFSKRCER